MRLEGWSPVTRAAQVLGAATDGYTTQRAPAPRVRAPSTSDSS